VAGRKLKHSPERAERVLDALRHGYSRKAAARHALIAHTTMLRWIAHVPDFADAVRTAEAEAEMQAVATIMRAAEQGDWRASLWWLERRHPAEWGRG
jgi:hypothetical protein